jgi:hypothetical protein
MTSNDREHRAIIDAEHLRLLSIFHVIAGALGLVGVLFSLFYLVMFQTFLASPEAGVPPSDLPSEQMLSLFRWLISGTAVWLLVCAVANLVSAYYLRARRRRTFSMVVAGVNCIFFPLGTLLGVLTLIVLNRGSVIQMYDSQLGAPEQTAGQPSP